MAVSTYRIGTPRRPGEGLRLGTVRFLPRGVPKQDYARLDYFDVWLPLLAPTRDLLTWLKKGPATPQRSKQFFARFRRHLVTNTDARQTLILLAQLGKTTNLSVGCYCEDESTCHRSVLIQLLCEFGKVGT
jgi:uncharacterized protein YeaO (DUF488 family)